MKRNLVLVALIAALVASLVTWHLKDTAGPQLVQAQGGQYVSLTFAPLVRKALPAVVSVRSEVRVEQTRNPQGRRRAPQNVPPGFEDFFDFFGSPFGGGGDQAPRRGGGEGSGVIVTADGYIITNNHVVEGATDVKVTLDDKREFTAKTIGNDPRTDLAVLKIDASNLPTLPISDSTKVQSGDVVLAIGNPFGFARTVTMGIVSATGRAGLNPENYEDFIQTDAAINPGNSGGALINASGQLIGINTAIISRTGGNQGIGFAIPANMAKLVMDQLVKTGKVTRGYIGAYLQDITPELARAFKTQSATGTVVTRLEPGGPAAKAGLQVGDVITSVEGQPVEDSGHLRLRISQTAPGTTVTLGVQREGADRKVQVTLGRLPDTGAAPGEEGPGLEGGKESALSGVSVDALNAEIRQQLNLPTEVSGVVVTQVTRNSAAWEAGLRRGDVITQVNRKPVTSVSEFETALPPAGQSVLLLVFRGGGQLFIPIEPPRQ